MAEKKKKIDKDGYDVQGREARFIAAMFDLKYAKAPDVTVHVSLHGDHPRVSVTAGDITETCTMLPKDTFLDKHSLGHSAKVHYDMVSNTLTGQVLVNRDGKKTAYQLSDDFGVHEAIIKHISGLREALLNHLAAPEPDKPHLPLTPKPHLKRSYNTRTRKADVYFLLSPVEAREMAVMFHQKYAACENISGGITTDESQTRVRLSADDSELRLIADKTFISLTMRDYDPKQDTARYYIFDIQTGNLEEKGIDSVRQKIVTLGMVEGEERERIVQKMEKLMQCAEIHISEPRTTVTGERKYEKHITHLEDRSLIH